MSVPDETMRVLVRLTEAVQAYLDSRMIVSADIALELRQALKAAQAVVRARPGA